MKARIGGFPTPTFSDAGHDLTAARMYRGTLLPGAYWLNVFAAGLGHFFHEGETGTAHGGFDFAFDLTPVQQDPPSPTPEPSSLLLLSTGGLAILRRYRVRE